MPISPNQGPTSGGTVVTITGTNLSNATVYFNSTQANIITNTVTMITVTNPPGNGVANVTVTTAGGTSNPVYFYYIENPIMLSISPDSGDVAGANNVTITGLNLSTATSVNFNSTPVVPTVVSDSQLSVVAPAGILGSVDVSVVTAGGTSSGFSYRYLQAPTIISVTPTSGPVNGGTSVTITGTDLSTTESVTVGGINASFGVINSTTVAIITPVGTAGPADITVTTTAGSATAVGAFTYLSNPGI